jgi:putative membrane protein insertion efficiency factor
MTGPFIWLRRAAVLPIRLYQWTLSPLLPRSCRFAPSCSEYAAEAILTHGPRRGVPLALRRLARCHPWGGHGYDPVPPAPLGAAPLARPHNNAISRAPFARPGTR